MSFCFIVGRCPNIPTLVISFQKWKSQDRCCSTISLAFGTGELDSFTRPKRHYHPDGCAHQFFDVIHPNFSASPPYRIPHDLYYTSAKYRRLNWICARLIQQHRYLFSISHIIFAFIVMLD